MRLPLNLPQAQQSTQWKQQLDPILALPPLQGSFLNDITVTSGNNVINHGLSRLQQGWILVDSTVSTSGPIYRSGEFNTTTLTLNIPGAGTISLWVY